MSNVWMTRGSGYDIRVVVQKCAAIANRGFNFEGQPNLVVSFVRIFDLTGKNSSSQKNEIFQQRWCCTSKLNPPIQGFGVLNGETAVVL